MPEMRRDPCRGQRHGAGGIGHLTAEPVEAPSASRRVGRHRNDSGTQAGQKGDDIVEARIVKDDRAFPGIPEDTKSRRQNGSPVVQFGIADERRLRVPLAEKA